MYRSEDIKSLLPEDKNQTEGGYYAFHCVEAYLYKQSVETTITKYDKRYHKHSKLSNIFLLNLRTVATDSLYHRKNPNQTNSPKSKSHKRTRKEKTLTK